MTGTVLNVIAVLIGGSIGTVLGNRLPRKVQETVMHGLELICRHSFCRQPGARRSSQCRDGSIGAGRAVRTGNGSRQRSWRGQPGNG